MQYFWEGTVQSHAKVFAHVRSEQVFTTDQQKKKLNRSVFSYTYLYKKYLTFNRKLSKANIEKKKS